MKPTASLVNTSRGPIVVEADLLEALRKGKIAGAAIDVFDQEPLPLDHPFRSLPNLLATPHIGYVSVRPEGACHQRRRVPPRELSIDLVADERLGRATARAEAS